MNNNSGIAVSCKERKAQLVQIGEPAAPAYWKSLEELHHVPHFTGEFPGGLPRMDGRDEAGSTRRDFLAMMGFSLAAASLAGCRAPVQNAIPLLVGSDDIIPGVANYYATTCRGCASSCSLVVKQRDGRPIKIEGNAESTLFGNGTCATGQATVLSLYDDARFRGPTWHGQPAKWVEVDQHVIDSLREATANNRKIALLSSTINSPSTLKIIAAFKKQHPNFSHVMYDAVSYSAIRAANAQLFERAVIPHYSFDKARVIVGLGADFLGTWLSPVEFARQYAGRKLAKARTPSLHIQFESSFSVTGSNADVRVPLAPSEIGTVAVALLRRVAQKTGVAGVPEAPEPISDSQKLDSVADELWKHRGESLVVSGVNDVSVQTVVGALNWFLGNAGKTLDLVQPSLQRGGDDAAVAELIEAMNRGEVHTLILHGVNPVYDYAEPEDFISGLEKAALSVSLSDRPDETTAHVHAICPDHHFLEAWGDAEPVAGHFSLAQPLIAPLFETRAAQESLLRWAGNPQPDYYSYLREFWRENFFAQQKAAQNFDSFWDQTLQDGVASFPSETAASSPSLRGDWKTAVHAILQAAGNSHTADHYALHFYESVALRDGGHANNPWLQELPDPVSKVTWGNYAAIAPGLAQKLALAGGDVVRLKTERGQIELPLLVQPGQHSGTISVALGYGRKLAGKVGDDVGVNVFSLTSVSSGGRSFFVGEAALEKTGRRDTVVSSQNHFSMEGRPIVLETTLTELKQETENGENQEPLPTLWAERLHGEHAWGMAIDMNACTGCSACVVACQAENNVPVVGKDQVRRERIMHWIRIDRYYSGPEENPVSVHQPMMCQHCQNAPCETVCPVVATTTSSEGLNQQVYNRCIGTRYCANNCPYKVRRFNWYNYTDNMTFDFNMTGPLGRMVLNPDVVVRSRGVMEKCSLCVQRIQLAKNIALQGKRELVDGDIQTACQQACPTEAIVFGDFKDPGSRVSQLRQNQRHYQVLEELGVRPNVGYLKKIRNPLANT